VKGKVPQLLEVLDKYDLQNLLDFFQQQSVWRKLVFTTSPIRILHAII
jgi:hypothetical protein